MILGPNHKDNCDGTVWRHSGEGYNRVRVCNCGAEDHDPESGALNNLLESFMKHGRHLSNIYDPHKPDAERYLTYSYNAMMNGPSACREEWNHHMDWVRKNVIGRPQATPTYTVEQLEAMGMVGLYAPLGEKS